MTIKYIRKLNCEVMELDDEYMIINAERYTVTELNKVGGFCWDLLAEDHSVEEIIEAVRNKFKVTDPSLEEDIQAFITNLKDCGLIECVHGLIVHE
jgi:hypothetical protein